FPLFALNFAIIWYMARHSVPEVRTASKFILVSQLIAAVAVVTFKYLKTDRVPKDRSLLQELVHYRYYRNIKEGLSVHFGSYGIALPLKILRILRDYPDFWILLFGVLLGIAVFVYLYHLTSSSQFTGSKRTPAWIVMAVGLFVFGLG